MSKKPDSVTLVIATCGECPHHHIGSYYSLDGFDRGRDWNCIKANRNIAAFVEWASEEPKTIPDWCPLRSRK